MRDAPPLDGPQPTGGQPSEKPPGLWTWLNEKVDLALYQPETLSDAIVSHLTGRDGDYYVLKNPVETTYCRLCDRDHFLWERMDGVRTVKDLVVDYFLEYGSFAFSRVAHLVQGLKAGSFLTERPVNVYQQLRIQLDLRRPAHRLSHVFQALLQSQFALRGLDRLVDSTYRRVGHLLFAQPLQLLWLTVSAVGLYAFARAVSTGQYGLVTIAGSVQLGILGLIMSNLCAIILHEMAHALTVKHYGREVNRGGFMIYFGLPAFFVDTTDIWLEGKRARLAVTWAGPYSGLILGGLASITLLAWPENTLNPLLFQLAFLTYLSVFLNINPLLEMDGYYLLMDWLEIPMLRQKSLEFIRRGLWRKLAAIEKRGLASIRTSFSREEKIFAAFGLLSAIWSAYAVLMAVYFWQQRVSGVMRDLWAGGSNLGRTGLAVGMVAISSIFVLSIALALRGRARELLGLASRRGFFGNTWHLAGMLLALAAALAAILSLLGSPLLSAALTVFALAACTVLAWRAAVDRAGSGLSRFFWLVGLFSLLLSFGRLADLLSAGDPMLIGALLATGTALELGALVTLLMAGLVLFGNADLRELRTWERALLLLGSSLSYGLVFWLATTYRASGLPLAELLLTIFSPLAPLLTLTVLVPTLFSFWRTVFGPAWLTFSLSLGALWATTLLGLRPLPPSLLLAASLLLHHLAYRRVAHLRYPKPARLDLSDRRRLERAFGWSVSALLDQLCQLAGDRACRALAGRFNTYAVAAGWPVSIDGRRAEDRLSEDVSLIQRGECYAAALSLLLDLIAQDIGEPSTERALQAAYDQLPWEEREIGVQYLFRDVKRAEVLGQTFRSTRHDYQRLLRRMPLFATMTAKELDLLLSRLQAEQHGAGKAIIHQGDAGDRFYIVRRGHVEVTQRDESGVTKVVNQLERGGYFGEVALLRDAPRNATCRATVPTETLSLSRQDFDALVAHHFALRQKVDRSLSRAELLRRLPLFAEMDGLQIQHLAARLQEQKLEAGTAFIHQGELGEVFYVIESGRVEVFVSEEGQHRVVAERGPGEYVGEIALLLEVPRTASVRTLEATDLLVLHRDDFQRLVTEHLFVSRGLEQESSRRMLDLRRTAAQPSS